MIIAAIAYYTYYFNSLSQYLASWNQNKILSIKHWPKL